MMDRIRRSLLIGAAATAISAFANVGIASSADGDTTIKRGGTLSVGFASDSKTLDPLISVQSNERQVLYLVFNTLVKFGTDFSIKPELAERWDIQDDGKRVVFQLRKGVKFHDGTDFDAAAVKWNIERRLDPAISSSQRDVLSPIIDGVDVVDPATVAFRLKRRYPGLLSLLGERPGFMVSPTAYEKAQGQFGAHPVGTGPFVFQEWRRGSSLTLDRNTSYWEQGLPYLDRIVFRDFAGSVVGIQRLLTGEIDFVPDLSPQEIRTIETKPEVTLMPITVGRWYSLQWQVNKPPFNSAKLREGIAAAIDRTRINDIVMRGRGVVSNGPTPPGLWWHNADLKPLKYDPKQAEAMIKDSGLPAGTELTLYVPQITVFQQICQLVQEQLGAVGLKVKLSPVSASDWYARLVDGTSNFSPNRWTQRPDPDSLISILFQTTGFQNTTKYSNPKVDELIAKANSIYDNGERKKLYDEIQQIVMQDLPMLPLFFSAEYAAMRKSVKNYEWIPDQIPRFREVWKDEKTQ